MSDHERWQAVVTRDASWDGKFVYCVKTTKIFCRPICKARLARRANVEFHTTPAQAEAAGYRACKRCQPLLASYTPEADKVKVVCELLDALPDAADVPSLDVLAAEVRLTKHHFHRLFKRETGVTPRQYVFAARNRRREIEGGESSATASVWSPMTPVDPSMGMPFYTTLENDAFSLPDLDSVTSKYEVGTLNLSTTNPIGNFVIFYTILETNCGQLLLAFQNEQMCRLEFGSDLRELLNVLETAFPSLYYIHSPLEMADGGSKTLYQQQVDAVVRALEDPTGEVLGVPPSFDELPGIPCG
ncbi:metal binding domain of Ada-domain-containing protein [Neohortaea acidophila]|uniref:Metal binding domain of Ada-domain-containing protein n=1 Tax=Neohortaea acidophila TaxID=245834 RepID=A0A6A6PUZ7_9PEZI|nr:metal binding domain of Ada-domain-containing protein [Neohortaea acidophila]KAF2483930.1 metal binding domain of Ada-domain-containing protein [Neohortaea acidophila]